MTTRKRAPLPAAAAAVAFALAGCATPGPLHIYSLAGPATEAIADRSAAGGAEAPSFLRADETLTGFAYDPFTDHFFLRLAPGNIIRVVDRPARAIKREFTVAEVPATGGGDLAVKPRTGHLYLLHPSEPVAIELTRLGKFVRTVPLAQTTAPALGIAYDSARDALLVLHERSRVTVHDLTGAVGRSFTLERPVAGALAFDAARRELYAPLAPPANGSAVSLGVFDDQGRFLRTEPATGTFVDLGERSLVRVF